MSHELTSNRMNLSGYPGGGKQRVKDSILLIILFIVGVLGTFYILRFAVTDNTSTGYYFEDSSSQGTEEIYLTTAP